MEINSSEHKDLIAQELVFLENDVKKERQEIQDFMLSNNKEFLCELRDIIECAQIVFETVDRKLKTNTDGTYVFNRSDLTFLLYNVKNDEHLKEELIKQLCENGYKFTIEGFVKAFHNVDALGIMI